MKTSKTVIKKRVYTTPVLKIISLDNEITLVLQTPAPPIGPDETKNNSVPEYFNNNLFRNIV